MTKDDHAIRSMTVGSSSGPAVTVAIEFVVRLYTKAALEGHNFARKPFQFSGFRRGEGRQLCVCEQDNRQPTMP